MSAANISSERMKENAPWQRLCWPSAEMHARRARSPISAHLALNTDDMKMTVGFYAGVLGMRLVHAMKVPPGLGTGPGNRGNPPFEEIRHYFFDMGRDGLLAFFEMPKGAKQRGDRNALGAMQHVSLAVSPDSQARIRARLEAHKFPTTARSRSCRGYSRSTSSIRTTSGWSSVASRATAKASPALPQITQTRAEALQELRSLTRDEQWLAAATAGLRE